MGWPKRILQPGERVLLRSSEGNFVGWGLAFIGALAVFAMLRHVFVLDLHEPRFWEAVAGLVLMSLLLAAGFFLLPFRASWALTDRRVLRREPFGATESVPIEAVEEARLEDTALVLQGPRGVCELPIVTRFAAGPGLYEALGARLGDAGLPVRALADMLDPGERVVRHIPPAWTAWLRWPLLLSGPAAAVAAIVAPDVARGGFLFPLYLVVIMYGVMLSDIVAFWRVRGWHTVLTDRRLLRRRPEWPSRCDAIPLDAVTEAMWDKKRHMLVVTFDGRSVDIPCLRRTARQILAALERNDRGAALA